MLIHFYYDMCNTTYYEINYGCTSPQNACNVFSITPLSKECCELLRRLLEMLLDGRIRSL